MTVYILRSKSGAGKSFLAKKLLKLPFSTECCADDYFMVDGKYEFDAALLGQAHEFCRKKFLSALQCGMENIIVSNTNTKESDFKYYKDTANEFGAEIIFLVVENRHGGANAHSVPQETLDRQANSIKMSLCL